MLKFKHIKILEDLLLEAELIATGNQISDVINFKKSGKGREEDLYARVDALLASLIENDVLNKAKADPAVLAELSNALLNSEWTQILNKYIDYISQLLKFETETLKNMIKDGESINEIELQKLRIKTFKGRLGVVWQAYHIIEENKWTSDVKAIIESIKKAAVAQAEAEVNVINDLILDAAEKMKDSDGSKVKDNVNLAVQIAQIADDWSKKENQPESGTSTSQNVKPTIEPGSGQQSNKDKSEPDIEDAEYEIIEVGNEEIDKLKAELEELKKKLIDASKDYNKRTDGQAGTIGKRDVIIRTMIEELRNWKEIQTLESQFSKVRTAIMTDEKWEIDPITGNKIAVVSLDDSAKRAYIQLAIDAYLEAKLRLGGYKTDLQVDRYRGVTYSPEINLPLFTRVSIPITSKQMAEASRIQYLFKFLGFLDSLIAPTNPPGEQQKAMGEQLVRFRKAILPVIGRSASRIARKLGGKEAQLKTEKWTRILFTSGDSGLDAQRSKIKNAMPGGPGKKANESAEAPGATVQTPASIGGGGDPVAPTKTSIGSGDNFQLSKSQPNKKQKNIKSFDQFLNGLMDKK